MSTTETPSPAATPAPRGQRSDARRNRARVLAAAHAAFAAQGPDASLEGIARSAGVGIGTLYRHFPNRQALVEAVFQDRLEQRCADAQDLLGAASPGEAFETWLRGHLDDAATYGALAAWLMLARLEDPCDGPSSCEQVRESGAALLVRAQEAGALRGDVDIDDVLRLVSAIALGTEDVPERADRLFRLTMDGLRTPANLRS